MGSGEQDWLESLYKASIPVCVCSEMDSASLHLSLDKMGMRHEVLDSFLFVTSEDDCDTRAQVRTKPLFSPLLSCCVCAVSS